MRVIAILLIASAACFGQQRYDGPTFSNEQGDTLALRAVDDNQRRTFHFFCSPRDNPSQSNGTTVSKSEWDYFTKLYAKAAKTAATAKLPAGGVADVYLKTKAADEAACHSFICKVKNDHGTENSVKLFVVTGIRTTARSAWLFTIDRSNQAAWDKFFKSTTDWFNTVKQ